MVTLPTTTPTDVKPDKGNVDKILDLPSNMDLPALTPATGVPTEVAIQQGGVRTSPTVKDIIALPTRTSGDMDIRIGDSDIDGRTKFPPTNTRNVFTLYDKV